MWILVFALLAGIAVLGVAICLPVAPVAVVATFLLWALLAALIWVLIYYQR
jgi:hypothetical protein